MLEIGALCLAPLEGELKPAAVVETRLVSQNSSLNQLNNQSSDQSNEKSYIYYLHFTNVDRRLDRWVPESDVKPLPADHPSIQPIVEPPPTPAPTGKTTERRLTRGQSHNDAINQPNQLDAYGASHYDEHDKPKVKNIEKITVACPLIKHSSHRLAKRSLSHSEFELDSAFELDCWYYSPFPPPFNQTNLFICGFCLYYCATSKQLIEHFHHCNVHHPPGNEIYRTTIHIPQSNNKSEVEFDTDSNPPAPTPRIVSVFEVDGAQHRLYCQRLSLFSKLFIEHKTAVFDVEPFLMYVLCEMTDQGSGFTPVAYFSKEKYSAEANNVACILTWPQHQRKGYGRFMIELSYALSRIEGRPGSPEKPLSDLGAIGYRRYWLSALLNVVAKHADGASISIDEVSLETGIKKDDIIAIAREFDMVRYVKSQHCLAISNKKTDALRHVAGHTSDSIGVIRFEQSKLKWQQPTFPKKARGFA